MRNRCAKTAGARAAGCLPRCDSHHGARFTFAFRREGHQKSRAQQMLQIPVSQRSIRAACRAYLKWGGETRGATFDRQTFQRSSIMYKSRFILGAALLCLASVAGAQSTSPDRPATTTDKPGAATPAPSTTSPGVTSTPSSPAPSTAAPSTPPSAPMASDRTTRDPATGSMANEPSRMDTARAPRADRN